MKKTIGLSSLVQLFLTRLKIKNGDYVCLPFYRRLSIKIVFAIFSLAFLTPAFSQDAKTYYEQGMAAEDKGDFEEAIKCFDKTITLDPTYYRGWLERGFSYFASKHYKEALANYNHAIKLDSSYYEGWKLRGAVKFGLANYNGALADYTRAITLNPNDLWIYYSRSFANIALGKQDSACSDYKKAKELGLMIVEPVLEKICSPNQKSNAGFNVIHGTNSSYNQGYKKEQ